MKRNPISLEEMETHPNTKQQRERYGRGIVQTYPKPSPGEKKRGLLGLGLCWLRVGSVKQRTESQQNKTCCFSVTE